jgi:hypothetical protein
MSAGRPVTDQRMRRSTAVTQVERLVAAADEVHGLAAAGFDVPLAELWVGGAILERADRLETYDVALVLDAPAEEVTWLALHPAGEWIADQLRLTKLAVAWFLRSTAHRVHNHRLGTMARVWTSGGPDRDLIDRLRGGELLPTDISMRPDDATLAAQLETELAQCQQHLATVLDGYHDRDWRRDHTGFGVHPEDHLWRAAQAVRELSDALDGLRQKRANDT